MSKPNILFFFTDQQRWDTCGCYGQALPITPNLDAMAAEGVRFSNAYTCQPVCGPCRAALMSGVYPTAIGCDRNNRALPLDCRTIAHHLGDVGYKTAYLGKWHLASDDDHDYKVKPVPPERRGGFKDYWLASDVLEFTSHGHDGHMFAGDGSKREFPEGRYRVDAQTDWLCEFIDQADPDEPWFMVSSYIEPHHQNDHDCYEGPHGSKEQWADFTAPGDLVGHDGDWQENYPDYLGCCHALDAALGRVRAKLAERGMADNTIIVYTADHGSHFRTRNGEYKRSCHDASLHVPFVVHGPGFTGGVVEDGLISLIDLPASILRMAGVTVPTDWHGRPIQDLLVDADDWQQDVFYQISESGVARGLRTDRWTYCVADPTAEPWGQHGPAADRYVEAFLYDNVADPHQQVNLVDDPAHAAIRAELRSRLRRRIDSIEGLQAVIDPLA